MIFIKKYIFIIVLLGLFIVPAISYAAPWELVPNCRDNSGGCNVCDAIQVGINVTKIMLGTLGSAALLMFVYGGVLMLISRGHSDQVQKGKDALINAVKGVIIVLGSWVIVNYGLAIMLNQDISKPAEIFGGQWSKVACNSGTSGGTSGDVACKEDAGGNKTKGTACGINLNGTVNSKCDDNGNCISVCEMDFGGVGYSCRPTSQCQAASIKIEICPGGNDTVCCLP